MILSSVFSFVQSVDVSVDGFVDSLVIFLIDSLLIRSWIIL